MRNHLIYTIFLLALSQALAQDCVCDEYQVYLKKKTDTIDDVARAQLSKSVNVICRAIFFELKSVQFQEENNQDSVLWALTEAENQYQQTQCPESAKLRLYISWAQYHYAKGDFQASLESTLKMMTAAEQAENVYEIARAYTMLAQLFNQMNQADKGIQYNRKAVELLNSINDVNQRLDIMYKISKRYLWHYQDFGSTTSLDSSELYGRRFLSIVKEQRDSSKMSSGYNALQAMAFEKGDYPTCLLYLDSAVALLKRNDLENKGLNFYDRADTYLQLKNYAEAIRWADSALVNYQKASLAAYISETFGLVSEVYRQSGDYKKSLEAFKMKTEFQDSVRNIERVSAFAELEKKYNQQKDRERIKDLSQERTIYLLIALASLLAIVLIVFFIRQQTIRSKQIILETEQRLNRARMNPHFFFNALSNLQQYALMQPDGLSMASNLAKFSNIMRSTLESTYREYLTIEKEIDYLRQYLEIQKLQPPNAITYEIFCSPEVEQEDLLIPTMMIQPFIENSIMHGLSGTTYPGKITISFSKSGHELKVEITDNGKGLSTTQSPSTGSANHISRATEIIEDRIYLLNKKRKSNARYVVQGNPDGVGVSVLLCLPLLYRDENPDN